MLLKKQPKLFLLKKWCLSTFVRKFVTKYSLKISQSVHTGSVIPISINTVTIGITFKLPPTQKSHLHRPPPRVHLTCSIGFFVWWSPVMLKRGLGLIYTTTKMQKFPNLVTLNSINIIYFDFGLEPRSCLSTEMHLCKF